MRVRVNMRVTLAHGRRDGRRPPYLVRVRARARVRVRVRVRVRDWDRVRVRARVRPLYLRCVAVASDAGTTCGYWCWVLG